MYGDAAISQFNGADMMGSKLFVGNLDYSSTEEDLREAFGLCGEVVEAIVVRDRDTGRYRGFGFVKFSVESDAQRAISEFDGTQLNGRSISVSEARERSRDGSGTDRGRQGRRVNRW